MPQVLGLLERRLVLKQGRAADRHHLLVQQELRAQVRIAAPAVADADVDLVAVEIDQPDRGGDPGVDVGLGLAKTLDPGHQPLGGEGGGGRDRDQAAGLQVPDPGDPGGQVVEAVAQVRQGRLAGLGQPDRPLAALEQGHAQIVLQALDLMADGGGGHVQLLRRLGEAEMAGGGLEGAQGVERRQSARHGGLQD